MRMIFLAAVVSDICDHIAIYLFQHANVLLAIATKFVTFHKVFG